MLEELLANMTFSPVLIAVSAAIVIVCFWLGWTGKRFGARRTQKALHRQIFEAKAAVPQLETAARSQDARVARLEDETKGLASRSIELARVLDEKEKELRGAERKVRNLTSELAAVKGPRTDNGSVILDGFEEEDEFEDDGESDIAAGSLLAARLKKTEALYEKLKNTVIKRDDQIQALQARLETSHPSTPVESAATQRHEPDVSKVLRDQIRSQQSEIDELKNQLQEVHQEKDMLADMAKRRSESNKSLKEASAAAEGQIPKLQEDIEARDKIISDREASIKRYLSELEEAKDERSEREAEISELSRQVRDHSKDLSSRDDHINGLDKDIRQRDERVTTLVVEMDGLRNSLEDTQTTLKAREETIAQQQSFVAASSAQLEEQLQTTNTIQGAIRDRDFKIEALTNDVAEMKINLDRAERQSADALSVYEKREEMLAVENTTSQESNDVMSRKAEDLGAQLAQSERWLTKTKESLHDRETQLQELENTVADIQSRNDELAGELDEQSLARRSAEADARCKDRQVDTLEARTEQAASQLKEQDQTITVFRSTVTELEINVKSLSTEIAALTEQLESGR